MNNKLLKTVTAFFDGDADTADYLVGGGSVSTRKHHYNGLYRNGYFIISDSAICEDILKIKV